MLTDFWSFLQDENNRAMLGWIGSGVVVVGGALWAIFKFLFSKTSRSHPAAPAVSATEGGIAAGRDIRDAKIDTRGGTKR